MNTTTRELELTQEADLQCVMRRKSFTGDGENTWNKRFIYMNKIVLGLVSNECKAREKEINDDETAKEFAKCRYVIGYSTIKLENHVEEARSIQVYTRFCNT